MAKKCIHIPQVTDTTMTINKQDNYICLVCKLLVFNTKKERG